MPTIGTADLQRRLHDQAATALRDADRNGNGSITVAEQRGMDPLLRDHVQAYRATHNNRVRASTFLRSYDRAVAREIAAADRDGDQFLTTREQGFLPASLRRNVDAVLGNVPPPVEPPPVVAAGPFGIAGVIPARRVELTTLLDRGLDSPTGLAFNPHAGSLWIVNRGDDSSVVIDNVGTGNQRANKFYDDSAHFMNNPMAIAFSHSRNEFATVQDTGNDYNHAAHHANMFMGPTLWSADRRVYEGGTNSHLDMLHHSPYAMGIAAGAPSRGYDNREYWIFNGNDGSIDRYFFNDPHALGADDHSDGETYRYADGELSRVPGVPSHLALDHASGQLYIADTGNGRIAKLNTRASIARAQDIGAYHGETPLKAVPNSHVTTVAEEGLTRPSGLVLAGGDLVVGDYATGHIHVFGTDGTHKADLDTGLGANTLTGMAAGPDGKLYILDSDRGRLLRLNVLAD